MFELSFGKMMIIAVVALIVLGPEKLPRVARTLGHLLGRARSYANQVKQDIDREMQMDERPKPAGAGQGGRAQLRDRRQRRRPQRRERGIEREQSVQRDGVGLPGQAGRR